MASRTTINKILDTAEVLFADKGFAETSVRLITSKAGVNLAAINYHFGSKKDLIQAVFARYLTPFCADLNERLDALAKQPSIQLNQVLEVVAYSCINVPGPKGSLNVFMRLLGLAYSQNQGHLRRFLQESYGATLNRLTDLLKDSTPNLPDAERFWRLHFMLGGVIFTLSSYTSLKEIAQAEFNEATKVSLLIQRFLPVVTAAMNAPLPTFAES